MINNEISVLNYIDDQPRALKEVFEKRDLYVKPFVETLKKSNFKKIIFFGSGTSFNVSNIAAYYFKDLLNVDSVAHYPTYFINYDKASRSTNVKNEEVLCIGISQSGTSYSTIDAMKHCKTMGHYTVALTENLESEIVKHVDSSIHLLCGKELIPPETRGYTVSVLTVFLLALCSAKELNIIDNLKYTMLIDECTNLTNNFSEYLNESKVWYEKVKTSVINSERIIVAGYGIDYYSTMEAQLKIGEMLRYPCLGYEIEEYLHGPTMSINPKQTIILIGSDAVEWDRLLFVRDTLLKYTERVYIISYKEFNNRDFDLKFSINSNYYLGPLIFTLPIQLIAAKGAKDIGIDTSINPFKERLGHMK